MIMELKAVLEDEGGFSTTVDDRTVGSGELSVGSFGDDRPTFDIGVDEPDTSGEGAAAVGVRPERASLNFDVDGFLEDGGGPSGEGTRGGMAGGEASAGLGGTI